MLFIILIPIIFFIVTICTYIILKLIYKMGWMEGYLRGKSDTMRNHHYTSEYAWKHRYEEWGK